MVDHWQSRRRNIFLLILAVLNTSLILLAVLIPLIERLRHIDVQIGDVAVQDTLAPRALVYESQVLTERARDLRADSVSSVYTSFDTSVARRQLEHLDATLAFISSVRADRYGTLGQKQTDLAALEDIHLDSDTVQAILNLSDSRWQAVKEESILALEQVMRTTIRNDRLEEARRSVPALISLSLPENQALIVAELVTAFVAPNSFYSDDATQAARQQARDAVQPVVQSYVADETLVRRGQVISPEIYETLAQFGLVQPRVDWKDFASGLLVTLLAVSFFGYYLSRNPKLAEDPLDIIIFSVLFQVFIFGARLIIPGHIVLPYFFPAAAFSLTVTVLFGTELALISILPQAVLVAYGMPNALDLTLYIAFGGFFGVLALHGGRRITSFFFAGLSIAISGVVVLVLYRLTEASTDLAGLLTLSAASLVNGVASASVAVLLQYFLAQALGLTTALQLVELTRPDHKLLQFILRNAPGTYQHSLQLANLAEQAAERIGADGLLTRVGALYHDVGKAVNPFFFVENQPAGNINPHDDIDPSLSAETIIRHVTDGLELARKNRLPRRIYDFIGEHHGTMLTRYQYVRAVEAAGGSEIQVDTSKFSYPGPRPRSRETALLMLADSCEARMRAEHPKNEEELLRLIKDTIDTRVKMGQLNDTDLTLKDLEIIVDSFMTTLRGLYHPRIEYPKLPEAGASKE